MILSGAAGRHPSGLWFFLGDVVFPQTSIINYFYGKNGRFRYSKIRIESGI